MKPILEIKSLSKKFRIRHEQEPYLSLRDSISKRFISSKTYPPSEDFWALKDISFTVNPGESIGIIGKNGAGKSTLLKILSRITPPTTGKIISRGRIASLLEVGTGFHPELTGRENVFLNGSVLGMKRKEIQNKFDEIVDFSGVERFMDTPLKHYSSGMQLRLAFAVAAFLEPEILIVDEVLAVGDAEFQKKCMGKMNEVNNSGRTILFVSHNLAAVQNLCPKSLYLEDRTIKFNGPTKETVSRYILKNEANQSSEKQFPPDQRPGDNIAQLVSVRLTANNAPHFKISEKIGIEISYEILKDDFLVLPNIDLWTERDEYVFPSISPASEKIGKGTYTTTVWIDKDQLNSIGYFIGVGLKSFNKTPHLTHMYDKHLLYFKPEDDLNSPTHAVYKGEFGGVVRPNLIWTS